MNTLPSVQEALAQAAAAGVERLDAQRLLQHLLQQGRAWLLAHDDALLTAPQAVAWQALLARCAAGEPLAYLTGEREFHGLPLQVSPAVLVPRPDTETMVDWALELLAGPLAAVEQPTVADLGTGSGAIALAVKHRCPRAQMRASDASAAALAVAQGNGERLGLAIGWHLGSWWEPFAGQRLALVLSNPPYIESGDPHLPALRHEPLSALVPPGGDGLASLREIVAGAPQHLAPGGWLLLEHGFDQADAVAGLLREAGFTEVQHRTDLGGHRRCTGGRRP
ncbi:peptide chain release factor N(5)-glutamine methyltransferase [Rubrivivax rivuli]|uniref:Release factor glutamine methyltransferase n=1 Tax=Rubrivivax rivuli TaxID=1862385 RepID=A0A437R9H0_9BURK|nr:peptide chain release factor N(5)-glutamine methyltransferase [Rubrivivax rivuli]RVU43347.1 peptide chain release factor N(5)-glutamine methyltransferase [Rubrivivax rivuli]